jgi:hypothetical protein
MFRVRHLVIAILTTAVAFSTDAAWACPMCKAAAEADPKLPTAFMASILFMMAMPFTLLTCFGVAFYRLSRSSAAMMPPGEAASQDVDQADQNQRL